MIETSSSEVDLIFDEIISSTDENGLSEERAGLCKAVTGTRGYYRLLSQQLELIVSRDIDLSDSLLTMLCIGIEIGQMIAHPELVGVDNETEH